MTKKTINQTISFFSCLNQYRFLGFLYVLLTLVFICFTRPGFSQTVKIDSLKRLVKQGKQDSTMAINLAKLANELIDFGKLDTAIILGDQAYKLSKSLKYQKGVSTALTYLSFSYRLKGEYNKSLDLLLEALKLNEQRGNKKALMSNYGNIGNIYEETGNSSKALEYYFKAVRISEILGDKKSTAIGLGNIANVFFNFDQLHKSIEFHKKAIDLCEEIRDSVGLAFEMNNTGTTYEVLHKTDLALEYYYKGLTIAKNTNDPESVLLTTSNVGNCYISLNKLDSAGAYLHRALGYSREQGRIRNEGSILGSLGNLFRLQKKYSLAEKYLLKSAEINISVGNVDNLITTYGHLNKLYLSQKNFQKAYLFMQKSHKLSDSIYTIEKLKDITRKEMNYEFEKKEALTKAEHDKQIAIAEADKKRQRLFSGLILAIASSITIIALIIFRSLRISKKQKRIIEKQKALVEEHQKEIIDSITYAKRIQDAILPPLETVNQKLPNSFVLYKPKDIVAGDFYWMEEFDNIIFIAAADCTGHGVPGAMVSLVCSNALTRAVKEFGLRDTGLILDKVRALVLETFEKSAEDVKDGMDISLLSIDQQHKIIHWSGANNPLWYIEKNTTSSEVTSSNVPSSEVEKGVEKNVLSSEVEKEVEKNTETTPKSFEVKADVSAETLFKFVEVKADVSAETVFKFFEVKADVSAETVFKFFEVKADKQPIGKTENPKPFTTHNIEFKEGTEFFLFTDGLADQFGGPLGKKYKYKQFENLLTNNYTLGLEEQIKKIDQSFEEWKGDLEQVDDVCVIGLRI
jgi:tetratricopeptide (TPR) repeat protein